MAELYGQRIQTTVQTKYLPFVVDTVLNSNVLFQRVVRGAKKWSGRTLRVPVKVSKNTTGTSFRGFDTFSTSATDNRQFMEYSPAFYQITCALPGDELSVADTEDKVIDMMKLTIQSDTEDMADDLGTIFYADGTGNTSKDPLGLAALVDDGNSVATIGGLSRSTYATLASTVTASSGTLTLAKMDTLWSAVTSGTQKPTAFYTTETVFNLYGQLLRPQERIMKDASTMKGLVGGTGFSALEFNAKPVLMDEKATSGIFAAVNENFVDWYALPFFNAKAIAYKSQIKGNDYDAPIGLGFSWTDWIVPANAGSVVGHIYFGGQFITTNPKRHGKLTGVTGI
ncbi:phage major capsid protein [Candidatus Jorgensenbacteria bacterium]|nr:phage major capsid protein [Candidatus Jorgensenbacteria bacterium]